MMEGVVGGDKFLNFFPIGQALVGHVQIVFVGQTPPDVGEGAQAAQQVIQIDQIVPLSQLGKPPPVIGMEQDQIDLDIHFRNSF